MSRQEGGGERVYLKDGGGRTGIVNTPGGGGTPDKHENFPVWNVKLHSFSFMINFQNKQKLFLKISVLH